MKQWNAVMAILVMTLAFGGCRKKPPPLPEPIAETPTVDRDAERRAAEERARLEAEERARLVPEP